MSAKRFLVESSLGEKRTPLAERERMRLIEHFARLRKHVLLLTRQLEHARIAPASAPPVITFDESRDADDYLAADLDARPVHALGRRRDPPRLGSTARQVLAFLTAHGGEHSPKTISTAIGTTREAVKVAVSKGQAWFAKRRVPPSMHGGDRVLYRLGPLAEADDG